MDAGSVTTVLEKPAVVAATSDPLAVKGEAVAEVVGCGCRNSRLRGSGARAPARTRELAGQGGPVPRLRGDVRHVFPADERERSAGRQGVEVNTSMSV